ncbi:MAG: AAA family ATPase [Bacteroidota bacterium]
MRPYSKKYIISGAPGTGKTTLIKALERTFPCMHEVSRSVIKREQENGGEGMPWKDLDRFVALVYEASIAQLSTHPQAVFADRSMLDLIAYLQVEGKPVPKFIDHFPYPDKFQNSVFFTSTWRRIYHKDEQRQQEFAYGVVLERALESVYIEKGFDIVKLPKDTVAIRVNFVHTFLKQLR